jgi:hypothetical protein
MSDQFALIDARGRAAGAALRDATLFRVLPDLPTPKGHGWVRPAIVAALVIAVVVGLVAVAGRDAAPVDERDPKDLRYVIDDLPDGWTIRARRDASGRTDDALPGVVMSLYGTSGDPTAPVMMIRWSTPDSPNGHVAESNGFAGLTDATGVEEFSVGSWRSACGTDTAGRVICLVDTDRGFVQVSARHVSPTAVREMMQHLEFLGDRPGVPAGDLAAGMTPLYSGAMGPYLRALGLGADVTSEVSMTGPSSASAELAVSWADDSELAMLGLDEGWTAATVASRPVFRQVLSDGTERVVWEQDGRTFWLTVHDVSAGVVEVLVSNVRAATDTEWAAIHEIPTDLPTVAGTVPAETDGVAPAPVPTLDLEAPITDVAAGITVTQLSDHEVEVVTDGVAGSGAATSVTVGYVVDSYNVRAPEGGGITARSPLTETMLQYVPSSSAPGLFALSEDPDAAELVVLTPDGIRYRASLQQLFEDQPGRFAMVGVSLAQFAKAQVLAADGTVIAELNAGI